jgi:hypothetical protein
MSGPKGASWTRVLSGPVRDSAACIAEVQISLKDSRASWREAKRWGICRERGEDEM